MKTIMFDKLKKLDSRSAEAYKILRTNIQFCGDGVKSIAFTSTVPNEGKSVVSFSLARAFAEDGKKVLFIDADIRKSTIVSRYEVNKEVVGLSHYLSGQEEQEDVIYQTNIEGMDVVFAGHTAPNPAELLGNTRFTALLEDAKSKYDYVFVDCPPLGNVIDAAVVAGDCDGSVIIIESNKVSYRMVQKMKKQLERTGTAILGCILNKVEERQSEYGYYGEGYYGGYVVE